MIEVFVEPEFAIVNFYTGTGGESLEWFDYGLNSISKNAVSIAVNAIAPGSNMRIVIISDAESFDAQNLETLIEIEMDIDDRGLEISDISHATCNFEPGDLGDWVKVPFIGKTTVNFGAQLFEVDSSGNKVPAEIIVTLRQLSH